MTDAPAPTPAALTIAGSDPSGGAGIQADLKTFTAHAVYGASVITALTAQNTTGVQGVTTVEPDFVTAQINSVMADLTVPALKTGMLATADIIARVAAAIADHRGAAAVGAPLAIVDPVMVATSGDLLIAPDAVAAVRGQLLPIADLITPNLDEAATLLDRAPARTRDEMEVQATALLDLGCRGVLLKGGHSTDNADDLLLWDGSITWLSAARIATANTHGTGCTLSAAIVARLVRGDDMVAAVSGAKAWLHDAIGHAVHQRVGQGAGPVDHLFAIRSKGQT